MVIGKAVEAIDVVKHIKNPEEFVEYCYSLVPQEFQHVPAIKNNQVYYCILILRSTKMVDWPTKNKIINAVMPSVRIVGYTNQLIEARQLINAVSNNKLHKYKRSDK